MRLPLFLLPGVLFVLPIAAAALPGVPPAPEPTLPPADPIHRNVLLAWNMMYGWAPLISAEHPYTDHEREGLRQARAMQELPEETRLEVELEIAIRNAQDIRNREHAGDTHAYWDALDHTNDDVLQEHELLTILGSEPGKPREVNSGTFSQVVDSMVSSIKRAMDSNSDGQIHRSEFHAALNPHHAARKAMYSRLFRDL